MSYIEQFLKQNDARLSLDDKWLFWDDNGGWKVLEHTHGAKKNKCLYEGDFISHALKALKGIAQ